MSTNIVSIKCPICGESSFHKIDGSANKCNICGNTFFEVDKDTTIQLNNAREAMEVYDFQKADLLYQNLLNKVSDEKTKAMCYYGRLLCHFGVVYIKDYNGKLIITISKHDSTMKSIKESVYYKKLVEGPYKNKYIEKLDALEKEYKHIGSELKKEEVYDVFICTKISMRTKSHPELDGYTPDSHIAGRLYKELTKRKLNVFYSEEVLSGIDYDAQIYSALLRSKTIIVVTTDTEYLESPWVQSEWQRWVNFIKNGEKKPASLYLFIPENKHVDLPSLLDKTQVFSDTLQLVNKVDDDIDSNDELITQEQYNDFALRLEMKKEKRAKRIKIGIITTLILITFLATSIFLLTRKKVTFIDSDGITIKSQILWTESTEIKIPAPSEKTGYIFVGWKDTTNGNIFTDTKLDHNKKDTKFEAVYQAKNYNITFNSVDGELKESEASLKIAYDASLEELPIPVKDGYNFVGWYYNNIQYSNGSEVLTDYQKFTANNYDITKESIELVAHYEIKSFSIYLDYEDNTGKKFFSKIEYGSKIDIDSLPKIKDGNKVIVGWSKDTLSEEEFTEKVTDNITLYAIWKEFVVVDCFEDLTHSSSTSEIIEGETFKLYTPTKTGYTFLGWYKDKEFTELVLSNEVPYSELSSTYYAKWQINKYTITFNTFGGSEIIPITLDYNSEVIAPNDPTKVGHTFSGWSMEIPSLMPAENITIDAIWTVNKYTISFNTNGGTYISPITQSFNTTVNVPNDPEKTGYRFIGWEQEIPSTIPAENITINAVWELIDYHITFNTNGGSTLDDLIYTIEDEHTLPTATKTNCTFIGWSRNNDLSGDLITSISAGTYGDFTLYAKYQGVISNVVLDLGVGMSSTNNARIEYGTNFTLPIPTNDEYIFLGWYDSEDNMVTDSSGNSVNTWSDPSTNVILTAKYSKKYYIETSSTYSNSYTVTTNDYYLADDLVNLSFVIHPGYDFVGIYNESDELLSSSRNYHFTMPEEDVTLIVKVEPKTFTITLDAGSGFCEEESKTVTYGTSYTLPVAYKQDYTFTGWKYQDEIVVNFEGNSLDLFEYTSNITLVADFVEGNVSGLTLVYNAETLQAMKDAPSGNYVLVADIDLSGFVWESFAFSGTFEGNNNTISNLSITSSSGNLGMFTSLTGTIRNLDFENVTVTSNASSTCYVGALAATFTGTLTNVTISSGTVSGYDGYIGGLVGYVGGGTITNCQNYASVSAETLSESSGSVGGLIGYLNGGTITECENNGSVTGVYSAGGIIGYSKTMSIDLLENHGTITAEKNTGGIIGYVNPSGSFTLNKRLINSGEVNGEANTGGIIGTLYHSVDKSTTYSFNISLLENNGDITGTNYVAGIIGYLYVKNTYDSVTSGDRNTSFSVSNVKNTGSITGELYVSGCIGYSYADGSSSISNSINESSVTGHAYVGAILGYSNVTSLDSCSNAGSTITATLYDVSGSDYLTYLGGYAGACYSISECENTVDITYEHAGYYIGGVVGNCYGNITSCKNLGNVTALKSSAVGGVAGLASAGGSRNYTELENTGTIVGEEYVGGVIGRLFQQVDKSSSYTVTVSQLVNSGDVTGTTYVAGNVGYIYVNNSSDSVTSGKKNTTLNITTLNNTGDIEGEYYIAGNVGYSSADGSSSITNASNSSSVTGYAYVGGVLGYSTVTSLDSCSNEGSTVTATYYYIDGANHLTFLGGYAGGCYSISNCINNVDITYSESGYYVGGLVGTCYGNITSCTNNGDVTAVKANAVGGVAGLASVDSSRSFTKLTNTGSISGNVYTGGVIGRIFQQVEKSSNHTVTISQLENNGSVDGKDYVAGISGYVYFNNSYNSASSGKKNTTATITTLKNTTSVNGSTNVAGIIAYFSSDGQSTLTGYELTGSVYIDEVLQDPVIVGTSSNLAISE